ncbi:MAG: hypothetical protein ACOC1P_05765 [Minisyncoccales bacterium]
MKIDLVQTLKNINSQNLNQTIALPIICNSKAFEFEESLNLQMQRILFLYSIPINKVPEQNYFQFENRFSSQNDLSERINQYNNSLN